jgi:dTDP-glucose 4,6-dehydratase
MRILITGGAGFIGSAVLRLIIREGRDQAVNLDKMTYAASPATVAEFGDSPNYAFERIDVCDASAVRAAFAWHQPDTVLHLAAESHVDRSIDRPAPFITTNIVGTFTLLEKALDYYRGLPPARKEMFRFHHVSTDEVFGALGPEDPSFDRDTPYRPRSPYAASKAAADHLVRAWGETYGLPVVLSNCSNNFGPYQFPEKLIPLAIIRALDGASIPVYGQGANIRDWLYVDDHAEALLLILRRGRIGSTYLVGGNAERRNIDVVRAICSILDELRPAFAPHARLISFVEDRPGHDFRYAINAAHLADELGWRPKVAFEDGLRRTVRWYLDNSAWWRPILESRYRGERLGLASAVGGGNS